MSKRVRSSKCAGCKTRMPNYDNNKMCRRCRNKEIGILSCFSDRTNPCFTCSAWTNETWNKQDKAVKDAAVKRSSRKNEKSSTQSVRSARSFRTMEEQGPIQALKEINILFK